MMLIRRWLLPSTVAVLLLLFTTRPFFGEYATSVLPTAIPRSLRVDLVAHFCGHAVLAVALKVCGNLGVSAAWAISTTFAFVLEVVQSSSFAPGRTANMDDFAAATAGSVLGLVVCSALEALLVREAVSSEPIQVHSVDLELAHDERGDVRVRL
jgi:hypothetical protein